MSRALVAPEVRFDEGGRRGIGGRNYGVQTPGVHVDPELPPAPFDVMGLQLPESLTLYDCPPHVTTKILLPGVATYVATTTPAGFLTVTGMVAGPPLVPPAPAENDASSVKQVAPPLLNVTMVVPVPAVLSTVVELMVLTPLL